MDRAMTLMNYNVCWYQTLLNLMFRLGCWNCIPLVRGGRGWDVLVALVGVVVGWR